MHYMTTLNRVFVLQENGTCMKHQTTSKNQFLKKFRKKRGAQITITRVL